MNKEVKISITAVHGIGADRDVIKTEARGVYYEKDSKQYLKYTETDPETGSKRDALIRAEGRVVKTSYRGTTDTTMIFDVGQVTRSMYITPMGSMQLEIETQSLIVENKKDSFELSIEYKLGIAEGEKQRVSLHITAIPIRIT